MSNPNLMVGTLYPDGEIKRDVDGIGFACPNPILCYIQRMETLDELKNFILNTMGAAMFDLHRRYGPRQVMELLVETRDVNRSEVGPSSSRACPVGPIIVPPLRIASLDVSMEPDFGSDDGSDGEYVIETEESTDSFDEAEYVDETQEGHRFLLPQPAPIPDLSSISSHFHMLNLDDMEEDVRDGGRGNDYLNLDGGEEFRVGHRFSCREAVHLAVKNYNIRRAAEYRVLESDQYKYVCHYKQHEAGCPWKLRVSLRINLGY
ncbi:hypothetical protein PIB30_073853 [Stylosanthes scabra]|uniref:Transposase MuDR plant domain-containing protein n=1 Tax=Stylosanthes scabra TaxID=79078 RepID=A0ABU6YNF5_9FABA|nr:hypothetical protein [Stylosanthes scabra]